MKLLLPLLLLLPGKALAADELCSIFDAHCTTYEQWIGQVWGWAMGIIISLSVVVLGWAGLVYMTSEGDPNKIGLAKKYIWGVVWGLGLLILSRVLLVNVLGLDPAWNV